MSTFYTGVDKQRYDAGEKFLPMNKFLASYTAPTTNVEEEVTTSYGIPNTNAFTYNNNQNYYPGKTSNLVSNFNRDIQAYNERVKEGNRPLREAQFPSFPSGVKYDQQAYNLATQALGKGADPNAQGFASYTGGTLEGLKDIAAERIQDHHEKARTGQFGPSYIEAEKPTWSRRISDFAYDHIPGINRPQSYEDIMTSGYIQPRGMIPGIMGIMSNFGLKNYAGLPQADQAFIASKRGYKGPTIFGDNTTGLNTDPFGRNIDSLFGNYAEAVKDDFSNLSEALSPTGKIGKKYSGATFNAATGMFEADDDSEDSINAAAYANKMNKMNLSKWSFDKSQVIDQKNIVSDLSLIDQARAYDRQRVQAKINKDEQAINEAAKQGKATGSVNPAVDSSYSGGSANPHTDTGWSGSEKSSSSKSSSSGNYGRDPGGHHWADGGRVGLRYGGILGIL